MIRMIGIDHTCAPVNVRAVFAIRKSETEQFLQTLKRELHARGIVMISTCNRMELWVSTLDTDLSVLDVLCKELNVNPAEYESYFVQRDDQEAIEHLFWMTSGLKSAILAEDQILTQVKDAIQYSRVQYLSDNVLEVLFRMAVSAGKRVKTEVKFTRANATAIEQAVDMLHSQGFSLEGKKCMVIGNGAYGKLAAQTLVRNGADVTVTLRQYHSGEVQIPAGCRTILYGDKMEYFPECFLVVSATSSPNCTLYYDHVKKARADHPMVLIDLAVPRDIEPSIGELEGYTLYDIDDFKSDQSIIENEEAYQKAIRILQEEMEAYIQWRSYRDLMPRIDRIRENAALDVNVRIHKKVNKLDIEKSQKEQLETDIEQAAGKVAGNIIYTLRDVLDEETFRKCIDALEEHYRSDEQRG